MAALFHFLPSQLSQFRLFKTFMCILLACANSVKLNRAFNVAADGNLTTASLSLFVTPHVVHSNNLVPINNFTGSFFSRNEIIFDILQPRLHDIDANDLLSPSSKNLTKITASGCKACNANTTLHTLTTITATISNRTKTGEASTQSSSARAGTDLLANAAKLLMPNASAALPVSPARSSSSSSSSLRSLLARQQHLLSRPKRYLSFPEGSSFSVAVCFTVGIIGNPRYNYMSFGLNWGVAYDLPNTTWILNHLHGFAKRPIPVAAWHRRSRRSLYKEIENVVDNMGYNGRACILRALCESRQYFRSTKMSMIGEMMRTVFSLPKRRIFARERLENNDIELYDRAYRKARSVLDCSEAYECGFSLLELAFGKYSTPPDGYFAHH